MSSTDKSIPPLSNLPLNKDDPPNSAWGLWGQTEGEDAALGSLNYLTKARILQTAKEDIQTGDRVALDLPLDFFNPPLLGRAGFEQKIIDKSPLTVNDDVISFNTQGSSQWDSLRHFAYQKEQTFYNGVTQEQIHSQPKSNVNSLQPWSKKGLAGRGILVDYVAFAQRRGIDVQHFKPHGIAIEDVKSILKEQGTEPRVGDVLFLRTGYVGAYKLLDDTKRKEVASVREWCGLAQGEETTKWLWERQFAAVVSDSPGFEVRPPTDRKWHLHPILLAGWGTPIGELFDLDELADICERLRRWSFFFTSAPLNYTGAVASPPNAIALF
ncbi:hypothetical protein K491DRAFT_602425 [Lophiostoma macrostomum CBS 122681]|uniref:Cyclase n=1 Tax=Lophiostoma macrostomum CBS 122681 TaxID=1314788 RepID=A0A6A6T1C3_9PLEO|nr:hypothetical protein K491DRAFT_602425 [Lophiostoma macrostomum CBS 122681]